MELNRRRLLGSVALAGAASVAGLTALTSDAVAYQSSTTVGSDPSVRVDWRETYNGTVVDAGDETTDEPALNVGNAHPGDSGTLAFRVTPENDDQAVSASMSLALTANSENGRNEPERSAGDTTTDRGELADALDVAVWYDTGSLGVSGLGGCDGDLDVAETVLVDGSLVDADTALAEGVPLGGDCLDPTSAVCVGISWSLPRSVGNRIQGDSVETSLSFTVEPCDET
ncbi:hypothetical protein B4589_011845 [Halolamina sp. CBA1230]|uniref:hypothetical protein n=1 Tax=Halolamina sp. CBA1230 TaxID=1853690 RepID=UPI0009A23510|nr:hypothetical protein [Halolamina sp. CBA1230]QKY21034.1 hypothetical protein B4589_011845 [Halolamina sp. CBA1230]